MNDRKPIVAIDGPVGSGKSSTARAAAKELGYLYIDSGAMYRAVTVAVLDRGIDPEDEKRIAGILDEVEVSLTIEDGGQRTLLNGRDVSDRIRDLDVTRAVSAVSARKAVRDRMTDLQRRLGQSGGVVMEGRDIGTVVFPDAACKIYLDAAIETRAERRLRELEAKGVSITRDELIRDIAERDRANSERDIAPLRKAPDAMYLDTTGMTFEGQVATIVGIVRSRCMDNVPEPPTMGVPMRLPYRLFRGFTLILYKLFFRVSCTGLENVPMKGGVIIAPNHASFFDPPSVGIMIVREAVFFAKKELFKWPVIRQFLDVSNSIPVDRGGYSRSTLETVIERLKNGYAVVLFPEGTRTRTGDFLEPKSGVGMVAVKANVPVVPCWIEGSYQAKLFKSRLVLHFMPPFHPSEIQASTKKEHYSLVSERIMCDIKNLVSTHNGRA